MADVGTLVDQLSALTVLEAALNLGLSIGLIVYYRNVLCVALGSLLSTLVVGWTFLWPWAAREAQMTGWQLARTVSPNARSAASPAG